MQKIAEKFGANLRALDQRLLGEKDVYSRCPRDIHRGDCAEYS